MNIGDKTKNLLAECKKKEAKAAFLFLAIPLAWYIMFRIYPLLYNLCLSFTWFDMAGPSVWAGLGNYVEAWHDPVYWIVVRNTLVYGVSVVAFIIVLSLLAAIILSKKIRGITFFRASLYVPSAISVVVIGMIWVFLFEPEFGLINHVLSKIGLQPQRWLSDRNLALPSIIITTIWQLTGYNMVIFLAGLGGIPNSLYDAAEVDGASRWARFWYITVPSLTPVTAFIVITTFVNTFRNFALIYVMTKGGPLHATNTLVHSLWRNTFVYQRAGYGAMLASTLLIICLMFSVFTLKILKTR